MTAPIKLCHTVALLIAIGLGAIALGESISADLHIPAARIIAAECEGFEALATAGGEPLTCAPRVAATGPHAALAVDVSVGAATPRATAARA